MSCRKPTLRDHITSQNIVLGESPCVIVLFDFMNGLIERDNITMDIPILEEIGQRNHIMVCAIGERRGA
jgi:hypothetical protein